MLSIKMKIQQQYETTMEFEKLSNTQAPQIVNNNLVELHKWDLHYLQQKAKLN